MKRLIFSIAVTLLILILFFAQISLNEIFTFLKRIDLSWAILGAIFYIISIILRTLRFKWLIYTKEVPFYELFKISIIYHLSILVLPYKIGELSFPYLLNKISGRSITEGLASLITSRIYDFFAIVILFVLTFIFLQTNIKISLSLIITFIASSIFLTLILFKYMNNILQFISNILIGLSNRKTIFEWKYFKWIRKKIYEIGEDFSSIRAKRTTIPLALVSIISWIMIFWTFHVFLYSFGIKILFLNVVFSSILAVITSAIPVGAVGNWGMLEIGWTAGFMMTGISKQEAIASGFSVHILIFLVCFMLVIIFFLRLK